jgi:triacylglycerol lipase
MGKKLEFAIGILNGAVGDYLARTKNGLATSMRFVHGGEELELTREDFARAYPDAKSRVVILLHGLMCTEAIFEMADGSDYGTRLANDQHLTPLYVRYNTGLTIVDNGALFSTMLDDLLRVYPVPIEEIVFVGYSMGGLVVRSASHIAATTTSTWLPLVRRIVYVGTPHRGAPLERAGRVLTKVLEAIPDPYTRLVAEIANLRSDGVKDLGDSELRQEDRERRRASFSLTDVEHPVPLLPDIKHYLVAGTLSVDPTLSAFFGDAVVPLGSAMNGLDPRATSNALAPDHIIVLPGVDHISIARSPRVYDAIRSLLERPL